MQQIKYNDRVSLEYFLWETIYSISKIVNLLSFSKDAIIRKIKINSTTNFFSIEINKK